MSLNNLSHIYRGLLQRNRAFASFKPDELETIFLDIIKSDITYEDVIFDPMSGYGGGMTYFGGKGFSTFNIELNPPSYYWQILINPANHEILIATINLLLNVKKWPILKETYSITDELFSEPAIDHINNLYKKVISLTNDRNISIAVLLPFVARFANYQRNDTNFTHFKQGGICSFVSWKNDFIEYLVTLKNKIATQEKNDTRHTNVLCNFTDFDIEKRFKYFVTSPPYPNYRDYSKIFKIENWVLKNILNEDLSNLHHMIGSDIVKGKTFGEINSQIVNNFLCKLLEKSKKLSKRSKYDIEVYYYPYFALYFYQLQQIIFKLNKLLESKALGYLVVNNNITRDIEVPVGKAICEIFSNMGYEYFIIDESEIFHLGNLRRNAKRINSRHIRQIVKVWKK